LHKIFNFYYFYLIFSHFIKIFVIFLFFKTTFYLKIFNSKHRPNKIKYIMNYNDFPILNNEDYKLINEQFNQTQVFDRKTQASKIYIELINLKNSSFKELNSYNKKILSALNTTIKTTTKLIDNLISLFNTPQTDHNTTNASLFSFINRTINCIKLFSNWETNEPKEYYKNIAHKSLLELTSSLQEIFLALDDSNLLFFKHM